MKRRVASWVPGCLLMIPIAGAAAGPAAAVDAADTNVRTNDGSQPATTLEPIVVTGSYIRRTDTESPSPVDIITSDDILKRGMTNIADVIHSLSSDNSGTLTPT